ncbi:hypothetical protein [Telmatospirillum sp. J64-1]|uniref:hypothetical protein n=1 Tax=Telmatospirillum sp. J64-1 TaxID=2502183 RepID=UPI00163D773E|nr:hypothetical protein [Telmatospirillum sp. J64-1]
MTIPFAKVGGTMPPDVGQREVTYLVHIRAGRDWRYGAIEVHGDEALRDRIIDLLNEGERGKNG